MLPYVLFIITISSIIILTNISTYHNEMKIIFNQIEQVKIESLINMARTTLKKEIKETLETPSHTYYEFPDGTVDIIITKIDEKTLKLIFTVQTIKENIIYTNSNIIRIED